MGHELLLGKIVLHPGDCLAVLPTLAADGLDSCVTDPPYHLTSIVQRFGADNAAPAKSNGATGVYARASAGFMGKKWDGGDIAFRPEVWREVFRVLKPGAHLVAFGSTRTYHRLAAAIEDAGFEIRDSIQWLYGSGFPKSLDVSKAIDKRLGVDGTFGEPKTAEHVRFTKGDTNADRVHEGWKRPWMDDPEAVDRTGRRYIPASEQARAFDGYGTALKPACEPIVLARKPMSESTVAANVLRWGTGALNIDGCRVEFEDTPDPATNPLYRKQNGYKLHTGDDSNSTSWKVKTDRREQPAHTQGRWPANVIHDGSDEVVGAFPDAPGQGGSVSGGEPSSLIANVFADRKRVPTANPRNDSGSAARFFYQTKSDVWCSLCSANIAATPSRIASTPTGNIVHADAAVLPQLESEDTAHRSSVRANSVENRLPQCHPPKAGTAQNNAPIEPLSRIVQNVSDAASLCGSCATTIARALAEVGLTGSAAPVHFNPSIGSSRETILSRSLASYVANRESTDTILTTTNLRELFGCVFHAIAENTNSEKAGSAANTRLEPKRLFYSSKADSSDRLGSKHPTVKPLDLIQYLCRLVTPPKGLILDPFAGTGTTGEAAFREGFRAVLIEREAEYQADIRRRMALCLSGPEERKRASIKEKLKGKPIDDGPLFGGSVETRE